MFRRRSFWIILVLTAIVWLMAAMSEHDDYPLDVRVQWTGIYTARYVVTYADTLLPVTINSNCFLAISRYVSMRHKSYAINIVGDTVVKVNSAMLDDVVKQLNFDGVHGITSTTESLRIAFTERCSKGYVPQLRHVDFHFVNQRGLAGTPVVQPDTVWLYGDPASLGKIKEISTCKYAIEGIRDSGWHILPLDPVWKQYPDVRSSHDSVRVFLPVDRYVEKTVPVPVIPRSDANGRYTLRLIPARVSVTLWVPVNDYDYLSADQVEAVVNYNPAQQDKELPVLVTRFPNNARVKQVSPATLQYVILHN